MPEYTFKCEADGCGQIFPIFMSIKDYTDQQLCPKCNNLGVRLYVVDLPTTNVTKGDSELKVGHLAKRNSERLSSDEKAFLTEKHNAYKYTEPTKDLPKGMTRIDKKKPKASTKQFKKDPKRKSRKNVSN